MNSEIKDDLLPSAHFLPNPMLADVFCRGKMVVLIGFSVGEIVSYIDNSFLIDKIKKLINDGELSYRIPTEIEKEYCFWFYNNVNKNEGAKLSGLDQWKSSFNNK